MPLLRRARRVTRSWHLPLRTHLLLLVIGTMIPVLVVAALLLRRVVSDNRAAT
jgi:hypothetical protein